MVRKKVISEVSRELKEVKMRKSGNIIEVRKYASLPWEFPITKISNEDYLVNNTGEIKQYKHTENRSESLGELALSFDRLRSILNANFQGVENEIWVTLTYRENMQDLIRLREDRDKFWKRLLYQTGLNLEYVSIAEPQARGAWHLHEVWKRLDGKPLYIKQCDLLHLWGHGGVFVKRLNCSDNIGAYLTAYLYNIPNDENDKSKGFKKGARLSLYPSGMNLYRCSKGIIIPEWNNVNKNAVEGLGKPVYSKVVEIVDDAGEHLQTILYEQYNMNRKI
jgi:hypothetical protein